MTRTDTSNRLGLDGTCGVSRLERRWITEFLCHSMKGEWHGTTGLLRRPHRRFGGNVRDVSSIEERSAGLESRVAVLESGRAGPSGEGCGAAAVDVAGA